LKLVIAEKPSVAQSLAAVLGAKERGQGYLQGNGYVVSWCVGHLIGLAAADAYDARYSKWCYEDLPIIPEEWKYTVAPDKKDQYEVLVSLMNRPDVESLVCATDAGQCGWVT
jgi:DNA topoisomerase-3